MSRLCPLPEAQYEQPVLLACKGHFGSLYIAWGLIAQNVNYETIHLNAGMFNTPYDGGFGKYMNNLLHDQVWHFWLRSLDTVCSATETGKVNVTALSGNLVWRFQIEFPLKGDTHSLDIDQLRHILAEKLDEIQPIHIKESDIEASRRTVAMHIETYFYWLFSQGSDIIQA